MLPSNCVEYMDFDQIHKGDELVSWVRGADQWLKESLSRFGWIVATNGPRSQCALWDSEIVCCLADAIGGEFPWIPFDSRTIGRFHHIIAVPKLILDLNPRLL